MVNDIAPYKVRLSSSDNCNQRNYEFYNYLEAQKFMEDNFKFCIGIGSYITLFKYEEEIPDYVIIDKKVR